MHDEWSCKEPLYRWNNYSLSSHSRAMLTAPRFRTLQTQITRKNVLQATAYNIRMRLKVFYQAPANISIASPLSSSLIQRSERTLLLISLHALRTNHNLFEVLIKNPLIIWSEQLQCLPIVWQVSRKHSLRTVAYLSQSVLLHFAHWANKFPSSPTQ